MEITCEGRWSLRNVTDLGGDTTVETMRCSGCREIEFIVRSKKHLGVFGGAIRVGGEHVTPEFAFMEAIELAEAAKARRAAAG